MMLYCVYPCSDMQEQLFRGNSIATYLLSKLFALEPSINFLKATVLPLVKELETLESSKTQLDIKNSVDKLLHSIKQFLATLQNELLLVPLYVKCKSDKTSHLIHLFIYPLISIHSFAHSYT